MCNTKEGHGVLIKTDRKDKELLNKKMAIKNRYDEGCNDSELIPKKKRYHLHIRLKCIIINSSKVAIIN